MADSSSIPPSKKKRHRILKKSPDRNSPTYVSMGIQKEMMVRLDCRLRDEIEEGYRQIYGSLPGPSMGIFIAFLAAKGLDVVLDKYGRFSHEEKKSHE